jgi:hypothetical protein
MPEQTAKGEGARQQCYLYWQEQTKPLIYEASDDN